MHQPFHIEGSMPAFLAALDDIIKALNTGILKTRQGEEIVRIKPRGMFANPNWRRTLSLLTMQFEGIRARFQLAVRNKEIIFRSDGFYAFFNNNLPLEIDSMRESVTSLFNDLLKEAELDPIMSIRDFGFNPRWSRYSDAIH